MATISLDQITVNYQCQEPECPEDEIQTQPLADIQYSGTLICAECGTDLVMQDAEVAL